MIGCFVAAAIIGAFSIFAFFGDAVANTGGEVIPNMFHLMFGGSSAYMDYVITWKRYDALTFLFVLQIIITIMAGVTVCVCKIAYEDQAKIACAIGSAICSLIASIVSFCTLSISKIDPYGTYGVKLGVGPICYSILNIISILLIVAGIIYHFVAENPYRFGRGYASRTTYVSSSRSSAAPSSSPTIETQKPKLSESEKADLLLKYKGLLDSGVITQEEFDTKKKEIL